MELFIGGLALGLIAALMIKWRAEDKRYDLELDNKILKHDVKRLKITLKAADELINTQRQYINQLENRYQIKRKEDTICDPFTDF